MPAPEACAPAGIVGCVQSLSAERVIRQEPEQVYEFLAELENHWRLDDRLLRLECLDTGTGASRIAIRGPLGLRRTARIRLTDTEPARRVTGAAEVGRDTRARVTWTITPRERGSCVGVEATVLSAGALDRLLLAVGGRRWMRRRFARVLDQLAHALEAEPAGQLPAAA